MNDFVNRKQPPIPWDEGDNIPWNEIGFSSRMLKAHLSQAHDAASRRFEIIDRQVDWIHNCLLSGQVSRILDLGCGPGFYLERLSHLGHHCIGIDYSPASIDYAVISTQGEGPGCEYTCQDIRQAEYPKNINLVMLIYGEFNVFRPTDVAMILDKSWQALTPGGILLLEPHSYQMVKQLGNQANTWYSSLGGLFFDGPHIVLQENFWDKKTHTATIRYYVVQSTTNQVVRYAQSFQAYRDGEYHTLLKAHGFGNVETRDSISEKDPQIGLVAIIAHK